MKRISYADMDPLEEIRAIKEEMSREFPTAGALGKYLREKYPAASAPAESPKAGAAKKPSRQRKAAKRPVHACSDRL